MYYEGTCPTCGDKVKLSVTGMHIHINCEGCGDFKVEEPAPDQQHLEDAFNFIVEELKRHTEFKQQMNTMADEIMQAMLMAEAAFVGKENMN